MWRAANGINPQDPRPTGGTQLETLPALWKQHLDRHIARSPIRQATRGLTNDRQHIPHLDAGTTTANARTKNPNGVRAASRIRPLTTVELLRRGCGRLMQSWLAAMADCRIGSINAGGFAEAGRRRVSAVAGLAAASRRVDLLVTVLHASRSASCRITSKVLGLRSDSGSSAIQPNAAEAIDTFPRS